MDKLVVINNTEYKLREISDGNTWDNLLQLFDDANIYQTWNYSRISQNEPFVKHLAVYKNNIVTGVAQVRIRTIKILKRGIAYTFRGPVWQKHGENNNPETFLEICNVLKKVFCEDQKLVLRINPPIFSYEDCFSELSDNIPGFKLEKKIRKYRSLLLQLDTDLDIIRKNLKGNWRGHLSKAERKGNLEIINGSSSELFDTFLNLYDQLLQIKNFRGVDPRSFKALNDELNENFKFQTFIAYKDKLPVSGLIITAIGNTGIYIFGASNKEGRKYNASYLLQWEGIKYLQLNGIKIYDLGGINPISNPSVYTFKSGVSNKEFYSIGAYSASLFGISKSLVSAGDILMSLKKRFRK